MTKSFVQLHTRRRIKEGLERIDMRGLGDPFGLRSALTAASNERTAEGVIAPLATLLNALDAQLTQIQLRDGDPADILQMVRWQQELFRRQPALSKLSCAKDVVASSSYFLRERQGQAHELDLPRPARATVAVPHRRRQGDRRQARQREAIPVARPRRPTEEAQGDTPTTRALKRVHFNAQTAMWRARLTTSSRARPLMQCCLMSSERVPSAQYLNYLPVLTN
jgi:hypothetical protein